MKCNSFVGYQPAAHDEGIKSMFLFQSAMIFVYSLCHRRWMFFHKGNNTKFVQSRLGSRLLVDPASLSVSSLPWISECPGTLIC